MKLFLNSNSDFAIEDCKGQQYTIIEAKELILDEKVENWNMAFQRLMEYNWDLQKVKDFYKEERIGEK